MCSVWSNHSSSELKAVRGLQWFDQKSSGLKTVRSVCSKPLISSYNFQSTTLLSNHCKDFFLQFSVHCSLIKPFHFLLQLSVHCSLVKPLQTFPLTSFSLLHYLSLLDDKTFPVGLNIETLPYWKEYMHHSMMDLQWLQGGVVLALLLLISEFALHSISCSACVGIASGLRDCWYAVSLFIAPVSHADLPAWFRSS